MTSQQESKTALGDRLIIAGLVLLCLFQIVGSGVYFHLSDYPPSYDCARHLGISLKIYRLWSDPQQGMLKELLGASPYYPPLPHFVASLFFAVGGVHPDSAHASLLFWMLLLILSVYESGRILFDKPAGLLAAAIVSLYPITFGLTRSFYPDLATLAMASVTFTCYLKSDGFSNRLWTLLFGLAAGLAQMTKWITVFFWLGAVLAHGLPLVLSSRQGVSGNKDRRFLHRCLGGYLFAFMIFAFIFDVLIDYGDRMGGGSIPKLIAATVLFHLFLLVAFIFMRVVLRFTEILSRVDRGMLVRRVVNVLGAIVLAVLVCFPWYVYNGAFVIKSTTMTATADAADWGFPPIASPESILKYLFFFESHQVHLAFFVLFILSLILASKKVRPALFSLFFGFAIGYMALTCIRLKDPRFTMPFLYLPALMTAGGLLSLRSAALRWTLSAVAVGIGVIQFLVISFALVDAPDFKGIYTRFGEIVYFKGKGYGSHEMIGQQWHLEEAVKRLGEEASEDEASDTARVFTLVNHHCLHYEAFNLFARANRLPLRFDFPPQDEARRKIDVRRTFSEADYLVLKTGGYLGPEYSIRGLKDVTTLFSEAGTDSSFGFRRVTSYELPDDSTMDLWKKEPAKPGARRVYLDFGGLGRLHEYTFAPSSIRQGEQAVLSVVMDVSEEMLKDYNLLVHLYSPGNEFMGSFGGPLPGDAKAGRINFDVQIDTSNALSTGPGQIAIGVWNPSTGERLPVSDFVSGETKGDIVFLEASLEILEIEK